MSKYPGKKAVVTGGTHGMGLATVFQDHDPAALMIGSEILTVPAFVVDFGFRERLSSVKPFHLMKNNSVA